MQLSELLTGFPVEIHGDANVEIEGVAPLASAQVGDLSFFHNSKYAKDLATTQAQAVILKTLPEKPRKEVTYVLHPNPYYLYAKVAQRLFPEVRPQGGIHPSAHIDNTARISAGVFIDAGAFVGAHVVLGEGVIIGANAVIAADCVIGDHSRIGPNATLLEGTQVGRDCRIESGVVIGGEGFGWAEGDEGWEKVPQLGRVVIGDRVAIGPNTTIDRGALEDTIIEDGVILDNLIQIGHNVHLGKNVAIAAHTAIAGSTTIGDNCQIAGACAIAGHLSIAPGTFIAGMSMVSGSIKKSGAYAGGMPLQPIKEWRKNAVRLRHLDKILSEPKK